MRRKILTEDRNKLGLRVKRARERAGFETIEQLRIAIQKHGGEVSAQYIGQIERGQKTPSLRTLTMILDACGVPMPDVLGTDSTVREDATVLGVRIRHVREQAGYKTIGDLWKVIQQRGGNITRQYLYQLERGKQTASVEKLTVILDACGVTMSDVLKSDLVVGPRADDTDMQERKLVTMLTRVRKFNPALARVVEASILRAYQEVVPLTRKSELKGIRGDDSKS